MNLNINTILTPARTSGLDAPLASVDFTSSNSYTVNGGVGYGQKLDNLLQAFAGTVIRQTDRGVLAEQARTNLAHPSDLLTTWSLSSQSNNIARTSIVPGKTAYEFVSSGVTGTVSSNGSSHGNFGVVRETYWAYIETTATTVGFRLYCEDATNASAVVLDMTLTTQLNTAASFTFTPGSGNGTSKTGYGLYLGVGPNGGRLYLVVVSGIPGTTGLRRFRIRPNNLNPALGSSLIIHHVQYEVGNFPTSTIWNSSGSATARAADVLTLVGIPNGTYDVRHALQDGTKKDVFGSVVSANTYAVPTDLTQEPEITTTTPAATVQTAIRTGYISTIKLWTPTMGVHMIGDSFIGNSNGTLQLWLPNKAHRPRTYTFDGVSGTNLSAQADRFDLTPTHWGKVLVIMDGGLGSPNLTLAQSITAVDRMVANLTTNPKRWIFVQTFPTGAVGNEIGSSYYNAYLVIVNGLRAQYPNNFVDTLAGMALGGDGSANDNSDIANGWIPRSLQTDGLHPNNRGNMFLGEIIANAIRDKNY